MPVPTLPVDLVRCIVQHLYGDRPTLLKCALVSRDWLAPSLSIYCSHPSVGIALPLESPEVAADSKQLVINTNSIWIQSFQNILLMSHRTARELGITREILPRLAPGIRKVKFRWLPSGIETQTGSPDATYKLFTNVHSLAFKATSLSPSELCEFMAQFPRLTSVTLGACYNPTIESGNSPSPLFIKKICFTSFLEPSIHHLRYLTEHVHTIESLRILSWDKFWYWQYRTHHDVNPVHQLIEHLGPSLQELELSVGHVVELLRVLNVIDLIKEPIDLSLGNNSNLRTIRFSGIPAETKSWDSIIEVLDTLPNPSQTTVSLSFSVTYQLIHPRSDGMDVEGLAAALLKKPRLRELKELRIELVLHPGLGSLLGPSSKEFVLLGLYAALESYHQDGRLKVDIGPSSPRRFHRCLSCIAGPVLSRVQCEPESRLLSLFVD